MIKLNESCSVVVTVKSSTIFCRYCDDVLKRKKRTGWVSAVQSPRTWKHVYIFSRLSCFPFQLFNPRAADCMTSSAMLNVYLSNFLIRKLQTVWQVQRCWMCIFSIQSIANDIALKRLSFCASSQQTHADQNKVFLSHRRVSDLCKLSYAIIKHCWNEG